MVLGGLISSDTQQPEPQPLSSRSENRVSWRGTTSLGECRTNPETLNPKPENMN